MTKRLQVALAVAALVAAALPGVEVLGPEDEAAAPDRIPDTGRVVVGSGDPGDPDFTLSPLSYEYEHQVPVGILVGKGAFASAERALDDLVTLISAAVANNRTLGGLIDWLDGTAVASADLFVSGAAPARSAEMVLVASYSTLQPL